MMRILTTITGFNTGAYYSTHYFGGDTQGEADAANAALDGFWNNLGSAVSSALSFDVASEAEVVDPATGLITGLFATAGANGPFGTAGEICPLATQGLIRWRTGQFVGGREIRGRTFIPGPVEAAQTAGVPIGAYTVDLGAAAADLIADSVAAGSLVVYSPTHAVSADVSSATVWGQWAVLRSRRD